MPIGALEAACISSFERAEKLMKNALFSVRVPTGNIKPALTFYKPKRSEKLRLHITGTKSWTDMVTVSALVGDVVRDQGFAFSIESPEVDLVNLKYKVPGLHIRTVPIFVRSALKSEWFVPPEELQPGRPINISNADTTLLMWSTGSTLVMLKRLKRGYGAQAQLLRAQQLIMRISRSCTHTVTQN